jgi:hypothetical protein
MIVPGGGLSADGSEWIHSRKRFFLSVRVLSRLFRGRFMLHVLPKGSWPGEREALSHPNMNAAHKSFAREQGVIPLITKSVKIRRNFLLDRRTRTGVVCSSIIIFDATVVTATSFVNISHSFGMPRGKLARIICRRNQLSLSWIRERIRVKERNA